MTKLVKLLSLVLALLLLVASFAACGGETPDTDPADTDPADTDPVDTDPPVTDPPETDPPVTDPPETDPPVTDPPETDPPETEPEDPTPAEPDTTEPELEAAEHTDHVWYTFATYTAYDAPKEDGTLGYLAVHCRYAGCDAIQDNKIQPVLANLDFEGFTGKFTDYLKTQPNVDILNKSPSATQGEVRDGSWVGGVPSQNIIEFTPGWQTNTQYYISLDIVLSTNPQGGKTPYILAPGLTSATQASRYLFQIGQRITEDGKYYAHQNFAGIYALEGLTIEQSQWYRLEYIMNIGDGSVQKDETHPNKGSSPGNVTVFLTKMARRSDGTMVIAGNREILGTFDGLGCMYDDKADQVLTMDTGIIKFDSYRALELFDNLIVATAPIDKP